METNKGGRRKLKWNRVGGGEEGLGGKGKRRKGEGGIRPSVMEGGSLGEGRGTLTRSIYRTIGM